MIGKYANSKWTHDSNFREKAQETSRAAQRVETRLYHGQSLLDTSSICGFWHEHSLTSD